MTNKPLTLKQIQSRLNRSKADNFDVDAEFNERRATWKDLDKDYILIMARDSRYRLFGIKASKASRQQRIEAIKSFGTNE